MRQSRSWMLLPPLLGVSPEKQGEGLQLSPVRKGLALVLSWSWRSERQEEFWLAVLRWTPFVCSAVKEQMESGWSSALGLS